VENPETKKIALLVMIVLLVILTLISIVFFPESTADILELLKSFLAVLIGAFHGIISLRLA